MQKLFLLFCLFNTSLAIAQKKKTITQRNFDELKSDSAKAQRGLDEAKAKLAKVENKVAFIARQKTGQLKKSTTGFINADSIYELVKKQKKPHFEIAERRMAKWQKRFDKVNAKYRLVKQRDSVIANRHDFIPVIDDGAYLSFNPGSVLEVQQGAIGLGAGYRFGKRIELWAEASYLYRGFFTENNHFKDLQGFRGIISARYHFKNKYKFFFGLEFRYKDYTYADNTDFENSITSDTLKNHQYKLQNTLFGAAAFFGKRFKLSHNGKFEIEALAGTGLKYRFANYKNVPAGYSKIPYYFERGPVHLYPVDYFYTEQWLPYFPVAIRLVYHL